jgi:hypothetical protein
MLLSSVFGSFGSGTYEPEFTSGYRWIMPPNADRSHMVMGHSDIAQEVRTGRAQRSSSPPGPTLFRREAVLIGAVRRPSGVINPMRMDSRRGDVPAGTMGCQEAAVIEESVAPALAQ